MSRHGAINEMIFIVPRAKHTCPKKLYFDCAITFQSTVQIEFSMLNKAKSLFKCKRSTVYQIQKGKRQPISSTII